jgi:hypothetical protein
MKDRERGRMSGEGGGNWSTLGLLLSARAFSFSMRSSSASAALCVEMESATNHSSMWLHTKKNSRAARRRRRVTPHGHECRDSRRIEVKGTFLSASKRAASCSALSLLALSSAASAVSASLAIICREISQGGVGGGDVSKCWFGEKSMEKSHSQKHGDGRKLACDRPYPELTYTRPEGSVPPNTKGALSDHPLWIFDTATF